MSKIDTRDLYNEKENIKMKMVIAAFITTLVMTYIGIMIDGFMGTDNNFLFTIIIAIITMGSFILYSIEKKNK